MPRTHLPWFVFVDTAPDEVSRAFMMGLAWLINAAVAETVIRTGGLAPGTNHRRQPTAPRLQAVRGGGI